MGKVYILNYNGWTHHQVYLKRKDARKQAEEQRTTDSKIQWVPCNKMQWVRSVSSNPDIRSWAARDIDTGIMYTIREFHINLNDGHKQC